MQQKQDARYYNRSLLLIVREKCLLMGKRKKAILLKDILASVMTDPACKGSKEAIYQRIKNCCHYLEDSGFLKKEAVITKKKTVMHKFFLNKP